jgi:hypothetical protein
LTGGHNLLQSSIRREKEVEEEAKVTFGRINIDSMIIEKIL